jgi:hypothetical protein
LALNYYDIQEALKDLLAGGTYDYVINNFYIEAMAGETTFSHMPFVNTRLISSDVEIRSLPEGDYEFISFEIDVLTFNLTHFKEAAIIRESIVKSIRDLLKNNRQFHSDLSTANIQGQVRFGAVSGEGETGFVALATIPLIAEAYIGD